MDDFNFWWYIIAAVIYFITRGKKKKQAKKNTRPGSTNVPRTQGRPKSFEELLKEITEGRSEDVDQEEPDASPDEPSRERKPEVQVSRSSEEAIRNEGRRRSFADDESRRVYEESIKMAEGADLEFAPDDDYRSKRLFKGKEETEDSSFAAELMDGFDADEAKRAVIYSEIFNRKY
ncbi:MAG: hypothetical protein AAF616_10505 [Bacteroidota bacterium]